MFVCACCMTLRAYDVPAVNIALQHRHQCHVTSSAEDATAASKHQPAHTCLPVLLCVAVSCLGRPTGTTGRGVAGHSGAQDGMPPILLPT